MKLSPMSKAIACSLRSNGLSSKVAEGAPMLSKQANDRLARVGPGTPCGELMRRYWIPIAPSAQLLEDPVRRVRVLGENLTLYRDRSGALGLIGERCLHRAFD